MQKEIYEKVDEIRRESYLLNSKQNLNLIKKKKGISELNITNFIRRFVGFDALIKIHEMSTLRDNCKFFTPEILKQIPESSLEDPYALEKAIV